MKLWLSLMVLFATTALFSQPDRWQQRISYKINVKANVITNLLTGVEKIDYYNNSPDTLNRIFFHTYWNAFQPNSSMDVRSRELGNIILRKSKDGKTDIRDWDTRVRDRIANLKPAETGYQHILYVKYGGAWQKLKEHETILEVVLDKPILPKTKISFEVSFEAQVPVQVRRSGRDNAEGVRYSMSQWYPKMAEYDYQGWNANPYVAREFYGVWGDFDVSILIDKKYTVAATGTLQNNNEPPTKNSRSTAKNQQQKVERQETGNERVWHFIAHNVHDFVWAADTSFIIIKRQIKNGPLIYVVHKNYDTINPSWDKLADTAVLAYPLMKKYFGAYPYPGYSFIQGGDGGMEYAMATLIKGPGIGTALHEWMHSWYQGMMGTNESLYPWMDEGFTTYAEERVKAELRGLKTFAQADSYYGYFNLVQSGFAEPLTTHADHYSTNYAYSQNSYSKGAVFLSQLGYITGDKAFDKILMEYYREWRFKHPNVNDFIRVAEKVSGLELQWYKEYWVNTTKTINYAIDSLWEEDNKTNIRIRRIDEMPMPVDVQLTFKDGSKEMHYIPLNLMYGAKPAEKAILVTVHEEWRWTHPTYTFISNKKLSDLKEVEIDPSQRMADVDRRNNLLKIKW